MAKRKKFGEILIEAGVLSEADLGRALERQKQVGKRLGQVLEEMRLVSEKDIAIVLARQFGFKTVKNIAGHSFPEELLAKVDGDMALKRLIFPIKTEGRSLYLAMVNPLDMEVIDSLSFKTGMQIVPCVTTPSEIQAAVNRHYLKAELKEAEDWWTVLVVDDQDLARSAVAAALKKQGYKTFQASNGAEGLKVALESRPHLILTDTVMPRMDGYEMFRALRANPSTREIPVIALSSRSSAEEEAELLEKGYFDFIAKPINPVRLTARVKRGLQFVYGDQPPPR